MIVNGIEFKEPEFACKKCGCAGLTYKYIESNKSIQARCADCGAWYGNIKYDKRTQEEIVRAKIDEWKAGRTI